ncbi:hypothetical protein EZ428_00760 [Pedobacter frigiditerrae]|uniref:Outer membrane protein beta-barrel domain-containing protein n=1 Tax=Pedobacter frigiditerrae TaxID=2530452 RepID=A0A4R0N4W6_9SPHI|nr:hypothetical protein [Pedobacter frigiditerrae]TCC93334.1 hypothetical protein EZ428_00760 [Pedobacter frigiditerrae]
MKELNDIDFDKAFKTRITEELPEFEEESWLKMETKLRKRERLIYYRYASILLLLLSFGMGFYLLNKDSKNKVDTIVSEKPAVEQPKNIVNDLNPLSKSEELEITQHNKKANNNSYQTLKNQSLSVNPIDGAPVKNEKFTPIESVIVQNSSNSNATKKQDITTGIQQPANQILQNVIANSTTNVDKIDTPLTKSKTELTIKGKKKIPISVAIVAGPDFSSTSSLIGGKTGVSIGATVAVGITKKLSIQTGISFGSKNYSSSAYDYVFSNPNANKANFSGIEAACEVVEIPLRASYNISENQKRSIELNAGLSSYLMIKENYVFKYNKELNRADRITDVANANQHYLSVVELSATYNIKLKNKKIAFGIEPYVKIPISGIGEGNVPLKSSGVSLKLRYDFNKN